MTVNELWGEVMNNNLTTREIITGLPGMPDAQPKGRTRAWKRHTVRAEFRSGNCLFTVYPVGVMIKRVEFKAELRLRHQPDAIPEEVTFSCRPKADDDLLEVLLGLLKTANDQLEKNLKLEQQLVLELMGLAND